MKNLHIASFGASGKGGCLSLTNDAGDVSVSISTDDMSKLPELTLGQNIDLTVAPAEAEADPEPAPAPTPASVPASPLPDDGTDETTS